jgi:hypothetical protein
MTDTGVQINARSIKSHPEQPITQGRTDLLINVVLPLLESFYRPFGLRLFLDQLQR